MKKILAAYIAYMKKLILDDETGNTDDAKDLQYWRNNIFTYILMIILPVGIIIFIPNIVLSVNFENSIIAVVDTFALLLMFAIVFVKAISLKYKKILFITGLYILSVTLLYFLGSNGPGLIYILSISIFIIVIYNNRLAYYSILINALLSGLPMLAFKAGDYDSMFFEGYGYGALIAFASNSIMLNAATVVAVSSLFSGLQRSFQNEIKLKEVLKTEGKNLEIAKLKAEESDRLKSAFLANMSHEIRTPMNGIMGFTELLADDNITQEEKEEYTHFIKQSSYRLMNLINDLIDISKIEAGQMQVDITKTDINDILLEIYNSYKKKAEVKNIEFVYDNINDASIFIDTDEHRLFQILNNLVNNALKYTDKGVVRFGYQLDNNNIQFYVIDSGIGINKTDVDKIFNRFERLNNELNSDYEGSGLGLSISKSLAILLKGKIFVESEKGKGSKFTMILPTDNL